MKFYEYGKENKVTIMLLPGNMMTHRQFEHIVPLLEDKYHVITVSFDGFDETGATTYTTAKKQAEKLAAFIRKKLSGRVDLVLSESLGGAAAMFLTRSKAISIGGMIIDGASYWNLGIFNPIAKSTLYKIPYGIVKKARKNGRIMMPSWLLKSMGLTQEEIDAMTHQMCLSVSSESLKATFAEGIELYNYVRKWAPRTDLPIACWHGENESNMKKAIKSLKKAFPNLIIYSFSGMGHGEFIMDADNFVKEVENYIKNNNIEDRA